ncbi:hypothetical protein D0Y65_038526, partial [Glycine soja]
VESPWLRLSSFPLLRSNSTLQRPTLLPLRSVSLPSIAVITPYESLLPFPFPFPAPTCEPVLMNVDLVASILSKENSRLWIVNGFKLYLKRLN